MHCGETAFATQIGALDTTQYWEPSNDLHFRWPTGLWMTPSMMAVMSGVTLFITAVDSDKWIDTTHNLVVLKTHIRIITRLDDVAPRIQHACSNTLTPIFRIHVMTQNAYFPNLLTPYCFEHSPLVYVTTSQHAKQKERVNSHADLPH